MEDIQARNEELLNSLGDTLESRPRNKLQGQTLTVAATQGYGYGIQSPPGAVSMQNRGQRVELMQSSLQSQSHGKMEKESDIETGRIKSEEKVARGKRVSSTRRMQSTKDRLSGFFGFNWGTGGQRIIPTDTEEREDTIMKIEEEDDDNNEIDYGDMTGSVRFQRAQQRYLSSIEAAESDAREEAEKVETDLPYSQNPAINRDIRPQRTLPIMSGPPLDAVRMSVPRPQTGSDTNNVIMGPPLYLVRHKTKEQGNRDRYTNILERSVDGHRRPDEKPPLFF